MIIKSEQPVYCYYWPTLFQWVQTGRKSLDHFRAPIVPWWFPPANFGRLWLSTSKHEVDTWLMKVRFCQKHTVVTFKVIGVFPDHEALSPALNNGPRRTLAPPAFSVPDIGHPNLALTCYPDATSFLWVVPPGPLRWSLRNQVHAWRVGE